MTEKVELEDNLSIVIDDPKPPSSDKTEFNIESIKDDSIKDYISSLKDENVKWRQRAKDNKQTVDELQKTVQEKAEFALQQIKNMQDLSDRRIIEAELKVASSELGLKKREYVKLADMSNVKILEDGSVAGVRESLVELKKKDPDLFQTATTTNANIPFQRMESVEPANFSTAKNLDELKRMAKGL